MDLKAVDVLPLQAYFTEQINLLLTRAEANAKGRLHLEQGADGKFGGGYKGSLGVGNLATIDKVSGADFLNWKMLSFGGVDAKLQPLALNVEQVALSDFFARVIVDPNGKINLQNIVRSEKGEQRSLTDEDTRKHEAKAEMAAEKAAAKQSGSPKAPPGAMASGTAASAREKAAPPPAPAPDAGPRPPIKIRKLTLQGGRVRYTDNFIQPNYNATLAELGGSVSGLSSDVNSTADVDLRGQVNSAPLTIAGKINPLQGNLFFDIKASVKGMELAPLSPYSGKYVGYGIERGKLSFDVAYQLRDRKLDAQNRLILDQLVFGERVENASGTHLPVQLAVALLRDRNGVIDVELPIGGSLDDPQFSVGDIVLKVFVNIITKAVTAPFSLLGSLFGGGAELSWMEFPAGRASVASAGETKLKALTKAMAERPAIKLEITGRVDPENDAEGLRRASIDRKLRALKFKDMVDKGQPTDARTVTVTPEEYPALLKRAYKAEPFLKPRNALGLQKDLPDAEMEKLMMANATVSHDDLIALGNRRAEGAKAWLLANGVPDERMFILAAKLPGEGAEKDAGKEGEKKSATHYSRVDFSLM
ncbi:MAG: DUF748 domain-containing protein [Candidatus Protistobacter heckmanni]|nr:DUF748 domain-containing protein [Candidatus Protistobacter heckmanni]